MALCACEVLASPPPDGEPVIVIPPDGSDAGRGRTYMRIGIGAARWTGSFASGHTGFNTAYLLPDGKHLFVCAEGAGYIIDVKSRTLVETVGTHVVGTRHDEPLTLFVINHDGRSLEAFGRAGRLWKTGAISDGAFRRVCLEGDELVGQGWHSLVDEWIGFSIELATGEVRVHPRELRLVRNPA